MLQQNEKSTQEEVSEKGEENYCREAHGKARQDYLEAETIEEREISLQCLVMGIKFIIPARPHVFIEVILDLIQRCM